MSYLLDTDWVINALAGRPRAIAPLELLASQTIAVSVITLAELFQKAFETTNAEAQLDAFRGLIEPFRVIPVVSLQ
jgi:predicted nucleic acid-binding protein